MLEGNLSAGRATHIGELAEMRQLIAELEESLDALATIFMPFVLIQRKREESDDRLSNPGPVHVSGEGH